MNDKYKNSIIPALLTSALMFISVCIATIVMIMLVGDNIPSAELAYQSNTPSRRDIHLMDLDHELTAQLTDNERFDSMPRWSPDGKSVVFISSASGTRDLYLVNSDGRNRRNLTNGEGSQDAPAWTPDGEQVVFSSNRDGDWEIYSIMLEDLSVQKLTDNDAEDTQPDVSIDGRIVFLSTRNEQFQDVFTMWMDGTNVQQLTFDEDQDGSPNWSEDGNEIVWVTERAKVRDACSERHNVTPRCMIHVHIFTMAEDGSNPVQLTSLQGTYWAPIYSPDSNWITYAARLDDQPWSLYMRTIDGSERLRLTDFDSSENYPSWRPQKM